MKYILLNEYDYVIYFNLYHHPNNLPQKKYWPSINDFDLYDEKFRFIILKL